MRVRKEKKRKMETINRNEKEQEEKLYERKRVTLYTIFHHC